jgi:putative membrane protein
MIQPMVTVGLVFALLAALLHIYIWVMESLRWTSPRTRAVFGTTEEEAQTTKLLAFNQGFYNLFLAIITLCGILMVRTGQFAAGPALLFASLGSMLGAAVVLLLSDRSKARAAIIQGTFPLIAIALFVAALKTH